MADSEKAIDSILEGDQLSLSLPKRGGKDLYLLNCFQAITMYHRYISNMDFNRPTQMKVFIRNCIDMVADDELRHKMQDSLTDAFDYIDSYDIDMGKKIDLKLAAGSAAIGDVLSYLDEYLAISKQNSLVALTIEPSEQVNAAVKDVLDTIPNVDDGESCGEKVEK